MKRFKAFFFLLTFCFSTLGYSLELHYCKGQVTDISFIGHAECVCGGSHHHSQKGTAESEACAKHCHDRENVESPELTENGKCCKTEELTFVSGGLKALSSHLMPDFYFVLTAVFNPYLFQEFYAANAKCTTEYAPPILERDITILYRTFLI